MAEMGLKCNFCHKTGSSLRRCTGCLNVHYCSKICQTLEWPVHQRVCTKPTQTKLKQHQETNGADDKGKVEEKTSKHDTDTDVESGEEGRKATECTHCGILGNHKKCSRCKRAYYCSHDCQQNDWSVHQSLCKKKLSEFDKRISEGYRRMVELEANTCATNVGNNSRENSNFLGSPNRFNLELTPEQARIRIPRPRGSLEAAIMMARLTFPGFRIVTNFDDIPVENNLFSIPFPYLGVILVAYMYRYHEHALRHGVYLMDDKDNISMVMFYLDDYFDNPMPYFSYEQVKPGGYICLINPVMHLFRDGSVGIRINNPLEVAILNV